MTRKKKEEQHEETVETKSVDEEAVEEAADEAPEEPSLEEQLQAARDESAELQDQFLRVAADFENFKKRMGRERSTMLKYAGESIFRELLPVVDNLERAVDQGVVDGVEAEQNLRALLEGVQLTLKRLVGTLEKFEVKPISSIGEPFDPNVQEALTMEASDTVPANHVINEFEKGYYYKDRLLRAARVIVSSGKDKS
ncbi:MAG: nucleotide exchange factor GrpE [Desulfobacterales bacterium]|nr:MAG: nucleotide exchange factor GrpE [Desulfobacterales bacterium]